MADIGQELPGVGVAAPGCPSFRMLNAPAKVSPAQCANRPERVVSGESSYIRERARELRRSGDGLPRLPMCAGFFCCPNSSEGRSRAGGRASSALTCGRRRGSAAGSAPVLLRLHLAGASYRHARRGAVRVRRPRCVSALAVAAASPTVGFPPRTLAPGRDAFGGLLALRFVREGPRGQQVGETQLIGQVQQRHLVPEMGSHSASIPTPYGVGIGPETASDLRPRQPRLLLEQLQPLREVGGQDVDYSAVVNSLSRRCPVLPQDGNPMRDGMQSASVRSQPRPGALGEATACLPKGCGGLPISFHVCGLFSLPSTGPDR